MEDSASVDRCYLIAMTCNIKLKPGICKKPRQKKKRLFREETFSARGPRQTFQQPSKVIAPPQNYSSKFKSEMNSHCCIHADFAGLWHPDVHIKRAIKNVRSAGTVTDSFKYRHYVGFFSISRSSSD